MDREKNVRASVAMAVYNGERFIREQLDSILNLMGSDDELVISYDDSADSTWDIINAYADRDSRIRIFRNGDRKGVGGNFQNAVERCRGKYIFYADQDDVWFGDKINKVVSLFEESGADLIVHDGYLSGNSEGRLFAGKKIPTRPLRVWYKTGGTLGCCMAFDSRMKNYILPFPNDDHDVWTINLCSRLGKIRVLYEPLIFHRIHEGNNTPERRRPLRVVLVSRMVLLCRLIGRTIKTRRNRGEAS